MEDGFSNRGNMAKHLSEIIGQTEEILLEIFDDLLTIVHEIFAFTIDESIKYESKIEIQSLYDYSVPLPGLIIEFQCADIHDLPSPVVFEENLCGLRAYMCNLSFIILPWDLEHTKVLSSFLESNTTVQMIDLEGKFLGYKGDIKIIEVLKYNKTVFHSQ